jgi:hypothetical protein
MDPDDQGVPAANERQEEFAEERSKFRALILSNPNYFGNVEGSQFPPVLNIQLNQFYEEIGCVGFQPQFNRLDAVVYINQPSGYGGGVCSQGTPEYVRFYLSADNGASWQDAGITSFTAYNIPAGTSGRRRLEYAVALNINPRKRFCFFDNIYLVRAILSWNVPPPPNQPNFIPVWGDVHNTNILIDPLRIVLIDDILTQAQIKLPAPLANIVDVQQPVALAQPKVLGAAELQALYRGKDVPAHRYALPELQQLINLPGLTENLMAPNFGGVLQNLNIDWSKLIDLLFPTDGNTSFEELECIGLNPNQDALVGVIRVKLPSGYSGGPCTAGSREYVTFWADFDNNGSYETCLGTTSVNVHDIEPLPQGGLEYSVFLPVNLDQYRRPCQQGAVVVRIRAILSWQVAPPCANPNFIPTWGNREHTLIHIRPGRRPLGHPAIIETVGSMAYTDINAAGYANGPSILLGFMANEAPFGGEVVLTGHLANPTDISAGATALRYKIIVNNGTSDEVVDNAFEVGRSRLLDGVWSFLPNVLQEVDAQGFYTYREDLTGAPGNAQFFVLGNVLGRWQTAGKTGTWTIRIVVRDAANIEYSSNVVTVRLDNAPPVIPPGSFRITSGGGNCADFTIGDTIVGTYTVADEHMLSIGFGVLPALGGTFSTTPPLPRLWPSLPTGGETGEWRLDTTGMPRCGYVVHLSASDRTIVDSGPNHWSAHEYIGLCLREPAP